MGRSVLTATLVAGALVSFVPSAFAPAGLILAENYGVVADYDVTTGTHTDNLAAINHVIDVCRTLNPIAKGCAVQWPTGPIALNGSPQDVDYGPKWVGTGAGAIRALPGGPVDKSGTTFVQLCTSCNTFRFTSLDGPTLRDFALDLPLDATDGTGIWIRPSANPQNYQQSIGVSIENVRFIGGWNHIACNLCNHGSIEHTIHWSFKSHGIVMFNTPQFADSGDFKIIDPTFWFLMPNNNSLPGGSCIQLSVAAGMTISHFKMVACSIGIHVVASMGRTGNLFIGPGSIEEVKQASIKIEQSGPDINGNCFGYGNLNIHNVQIANGSYPTYEGGIILEQGACDDQHYLDYVSMHHNRINLGYSLPGNQPPYFFSDIPPDTRPIPAYCIKAMDGVVMAIDNNFCSNNLVPEYGGIKVGGRAAQVKLSANTVMSTGNGKKYDITAPKTVLMDNFSGMTFADTIALAPFLDAASSIYVVDGRSTSWPANPGMMAGGYGCQVTVTGAPGGNFLCGGP